MKVVVFGDEETVIMFNLMGIEGIVHQEGTDTNFEDEFEELLEDKDVGIIIITDKVLVRHRDYILKLKMSQRRPIIIEVPSMLGKIKQDYVVSFVKKYIGIEFDTHGGMSV